MQARYNEDSNGVFVNPNSQEIKGTYIGNVNGKGVVREWVGNVYWTSTNTSPIEKTKGLDNLNLIPLYRYYLPNGGTSYGDINGIEINPYLIETLSFEPSGPIPTPIPPLPCSKLAKANLANLVYDAENGVQKDPSKLPSNVTIVPLSSLPPGVVLTNKDIGFNSVLYRVDNGNGKIEYVYATEGSTAELQDWLNNLQQGTGHSAAQYKLSIANADKLAKWADSQGISLSFTGHSLGGGLANANALYTDKPATLFNPAGLHDDTISRLHLNLSYAKNVDYYVNTGEIVDVANIIGFTPARGNRHDIGGNLLIPAAIFYMAKVAGVAYSGYLHTMGSVIANLDCN